MSILKLLCVVLCPSDSQHQLGGVDAGSRWWRCVRRGRSFEADTFRRARQGRCVSFVAGKKEKNRIFQYISLYSAVCCCSCSVLNFLAALHPPLLAEFAPSGILNPPVPDTSARVCEPGCGDPDWREVGWYSCSVGVFVFVFEF